MSQALLLPDLAVLNNGVSMPRLGLGTYRASGDEARNAVRWALDAGYRLIDTAAGYGNEREVGSAIEESGVRRDAVFITSKLENVDQGYRSTLDACRRSLDNLGLDYLDLYLIHWPVPGKRVESWRAMESLRAQGLVRSVGVSNFTARHLEELAAEGGVTPAVNQVECHPILPQHGLKEYCRHAGIVFEAYSPLAKGALRDNHVLKDIGQKHGKTWAQVILCWHLQQGACIIPKSVHRDWIIENSRIFDFTLDDEDLRALAQLDRALHLDWDPTDVP